MGLLRSAPLRPVPKGTVLAATAALWIAPVPLGCLGLVAFLALGRLLGESGLLLWLGASALAFSPLFSWAGWLAALPPVWAALRTGWFGWGIATLIGAIAGAIGGAVADSDIGLPFGIAALLALRAVLGRMLPLT